MDHFAAKKNLIPKIQTVTWDSDKNPDGFHEWSVTIASIVQTMPFRTLRDQMLYSLPTATCSVTAASERAIAKK